MTMFLRILRKSFTRGIKEKLFIILTVAFGASLASGVFNVALDVGDKMNRELKSYGANLSLLPRTDTIPAEIADLNYKPLGANAFLQEADLSKLKTIFWANNILGFAPYLETSGVADGAQTAVPLIGTWFHKSLSLSDGSEFATGVADMKSWWNVTGRWPLEDEYSQEALVGKQAAEQLNIKPGDHFRLRVATASEQRDVTLTAVGVLDAGGTEDGAIYAPLGTVQRILQLPGKFGRAEVSALTVPDNELAERAGKSPASLREKDFEEWYCTAFTGAIAYQIEESIPRAKAKPIRQIADSEGAILNKIQAMMVIISLAAVISSALGISSLMNSKVQQRRKEIALMKALGGNDLTINVQFLAEAVWSGLIGGLAGFCSGLLFARMVTESVFGTDFTVKWLGLPLILLLSLFITTVGSYPAVRAIVKLDPVKALYGR